jgi:hypothetical protein
MAARLFLSGCPHQRLSCNGDSSTRLRRRLAEFFLSAAVQRCRKRSVTHAVGSPGTFPFGTPPLLTETSGL